MKRFIFLLLLITGLSAQITIPTYASETDGFRLLGVGDDSLGLNPAYWMRYNSNIWDLNNAIISVNFQNTAYKWGTDETNATHMIEGENASLLTNDLLWTPASPDDNFVTLPGFEFRIRNNDSLLVWDTSLDVYKKASVAEIFRGITQVTGDILYITDYDGNLHNAVRDIGSVISTLIINDAPDDLDSNLTIPSTLDIVWQAGSLLSASSDTLTFNGSLSSGDYQIFDATLFVNGSPKVAFVNPKWFGATGDGATDDTDALQAAINFAGTLRNPVYITAGHYMFTSIYTYYDAVNNTGYPTIITSGQGRTNIYGAGAGDWSDWILDTPKGTVLECTSGTADAFNVGDGSYTKTIHLNSFALWGSTTGKLLNADYVPHYSVFENLFIGNDVNGTAFYLKDMFGSILRNIEIFGKSTLRVGRGLYMESSIGGNLLVENVVTQHFDEGMYFGAQSNLIITNSAAQLCSTGVTFKSIANAQINNFWTEGNANLGVLIYEGGRNYVINNGTFNDICTTADAVLQIGYDGTDAEKSVGNVIIKNSRFGHPASGVPAIRRIIGTESKRLIVENCFFGDSGGYAMAIEEVDQDLYVINPEYYYTMTPARQIVNLALSDRVDYIVNGSTWSVTGADGDIDTPDFDLSDFSLTPSLIKCITASGSAYIKLPTIPTAEDKVTIWKLHTSNTITINAHGTGGSASINGDSLLVLSNQNDIVKLEYFSDDSEWRDVSSNIHLGLKRFIDGISVNGTYNYFVASSGGDDAWNVSTILLTAYTTGMSIYVLIDKENTDGATLEINSLGAKNVHKMHNQALATGDVEVGQILHLTYDGTDFQMLSQLAQ